MKKRIKLPLIGIILALIVVVFVVIVMAFPVLVKAPIENQLSQLSGVTVKISNPHLGFNFDKGYLTLHIDNLRAVEKQAPIATINDLAWSIRLSSILDDVYHSSRVSIDTLTVYSDAAEFNFSETKRLTLQNIKMFDFFKLISINTTFIKNANHEKNIEISPLLLTHDALTINGQNLGFDASNTQLSKFNIHISLPSFSANDAPVIVPILISNAELSLKSQLKLFNKDGSDWLEFESNLPEMPANHLVKYLPAQLVGEDTYAWIKRGFIAGSLQTSKLRISKNLSTSSAFEGQFSTQLKDMTLLFDPDWAPLKHLNAGFITNGKKIAVKVHNTSLNNMLLKDIEVQIADLSKTNLDVKVKGGINTRSGQLLEFLKRAPLSKEVNKVLHQFTLSGKVGGTMQLVIPLDERASILDVDLTLENNRLSILDGTVTVADYHSKLGFHNNTISADGKGNIRGVPFDIRINPYHDKDSNFAVELVNNSSQFEAYIVQQRDKVWHTHIESESLKGNIIVTSNKNALPSVRLSDMKVTTLDAIKGDWEVGPYDFPSMQLSTKNLTIDGNAFPNIGVKLTSMDNLMTINNLQFEGVGFGDKALNFQGVWVDGRTRLFAKATGEGLAEFLQTLKVKEKVTGGKFDFDVRLACECSPWNMNYQDITGYLDLNVNTGIFTDKNPNLGRILSLLNINSIAKRLKLDVSDVTNKGFTYESIEAKIQLSDATATIDTFDLKSSSSQITLTGNGNIVEENYGLVATVTPAINDAVPVATYLTGGGLIGLGVWLLDDTLFNGKIIGGIVDGVVDFQYKITGPWDEPIIKKL